MNPIAPRIKRWQAALVLPLVVSGAVVGTADTARADDRTCRGTIGAQYVDGDVVVPDGAVCRLLGTRVDGNVKVGTGAVLKARGVRVDGDVQAEGAKRVVVAPRNGVRPRVEGNIQLVQGREGGRVARAVVDGDIQLFSNRGRFKVRRNVVDGNLQCKSNRPAPVGTGNRVEGDKEDQCRRL